MSEIEQFQAGREAFLKGWKMDHRRNEHWKRGWTQEQDDNRIYISRQFNRESSK